MKYTDNMTAEQELQLMAEIDKEDSAYAEAFLCPEGPEEDWFDPIRDGWVDKNGRP